MGHKSGGWSDGGDSTPIFVRTSEGVEGPRRPCLVVIAGPRLGEIIPIVSEVVIGRSPKASMVLTEDPGISRRHVRFTIAKDGVLVTDLGSANGTFVDGERIDEKVIKEGAKVRVGQTTVLKFTYYDGLEEVAQRQLLEAALRDPLTHAFNRRYFLQRLEAELRFAERHRTTLSLLLLDVDHFKSINDQSGHPVGDEVLKRLVERLGETLRAEDVLARYGGEEFGVLARGISREDAEQLGERLRAVVARSPLPTAMGAGLPVTVSIGVAMFPMAGATVESAATLLIERADAALYKSKEGGRNRVTMAD